MAAAGAVLVLLSALLTPRCAEAALTGRQVLDKCLALQDGIKDYVCNVSVKMDFPNVLVPERHIRVYAKLPDKLRVESGGDLVVLPRDALLLGNLRQHLGKNVRVVLMGKGTSDHRPVYSIKILPEKGVQKLMAWVWGDNWTLKRTEIWVGKNRMVTADWDYEKVKSFWLPKRIHAEVAGGEVASSGKGTVDLAFSHWQVNVGLKDSFFPKKQAPPRRRRHHHHFGPGGPPLL